MYQSLVELCLIKFIKEQTCIKIQSTYYLYHYSLKINDLKYESKPLVS